MYVYSIHKALSQRMQNLKILVEKLLYYIGTDNLTCLNLLVFFLCKTKNNNNISCDCLKGLMISSMQNT